MIAHTQWALAHGVIVSLMIGPVSLAAFALSSLSLRYELLRSCLAAGPGLEIHHPAEEVIGVNPQRLWDKSAVELRYTRGIPAQGLASLSIPLR